MRYLGCSECGSSARLITSGGAAGYGNPHFQSNDKHLSQICYAWVGRADEAQVGAPSKVSDVSAPNAGD